MQSLLVKGEVSNCRYHSSGHIYFTLKDAKGVISCVMFAGNRAGLAFRLAEGQQVIVGGTVDIYERDGKYQLYAKQIALDGAGQLYEEFERLKRELGELGMFAPEYKQPIPKYIKTLGVVTARTGAVLRDIMQIAGRRNPFVQIVLYPAIVQGREAPRSIVDGICALEAMGVDVMIVGRGGGSIEDLWKIKKKAVAQAVFDCRVPIISAVGHETDTTMIDFVADQRAPTPSAAAELAVYDIRQLMDSLNAINQNLFRLITRHILDNRKTVAQYGLRLKHLSPASRIREERTFCLKAQERLSRRMEGALRAKRHELSLYIERLKGLSPLEKLNSGYSYVEDDIGQNIRSVRQVKEGQPIRITVRDGCIGAQVRSVECEKNL
jgi:exodeoxyribonuclease VII large subunit